MAIASSEVGPNHQLYPPTSQEGLAGLGNQSLSVQRCTGRGSLAEGVRPATAAEAKVCAEGRSVLQGHLAGSQAAWDTPAGRACSGAAA